MSKFLQFKWRHYQPDFQEVYIASATFCNTTLLDIAQVAIAKKVRAGDLGAIELSHSLEKYEDVDELELEREFQARLNQG